MPALSAREVNAVRDLLAPDMTGASDKRVLTIVAETLSSLPSDSSEDFLGTLKSVAKVALPVIEKVGSGALQGAATGGPYGALIGAGGSLASGIAKQVKGAPSSPSPNAASTSVFKEPAAVSVDPQSKSPTPSVLTPSMELPTGQAAAAITLGLLQNTLVQQMLLSQVLGENGRKTLATPSGIALPRAAINQLLIRLLANAADSLPESDSSDDQRYLKDESGEYLVDPASPEQQAAMVLMHVNSSKSLRRPDRDATKDFDEYWQDVEWLPGGVGKGKRNHHEYKTVAEFF